MFPRPKQPKKSNRFDRDADRTRVEALESRTLLSASSSIIIQPDLKLATNASGSSSIQGYTPAQIRAAYGFTGVSGDGSGQTIAIIDAYNDPNIASDLKTFDSEFGLAAANLSVVSQTGGSVKSIATDAGWAGEISLDVEWAHAIAPGAKILLVEANSDSLSNLLTAVSYARNVSSVSVVSMSWGGSEFSNEGDYNNYFSTPSGHQGITFVASAGDSGAFAAEWPAASPNVLAVGGTTLNLTSSGAYESESSWADGGGGYSQLLTEPTYQYTAQTTGIRSTPDVAYDANPNTGFAVYDSISDEGYVGWQEVGGTSAGAPQWSALIAIADQGRVAVGKGSLDGLTGTLPTLYSLYSAPGSTTYSTYTSYFNDVEQGGFGGRFGGGFGFGGGASTGYDTVTGLGTPEAANVIDALVGLSAKEAQHALHAAHQARKLAKAAKAKGKANPSFEIASETDIPNLAVVEALDTVRRVAMSEETANDETGTGAVSSGEISGVSLSTTVTKAVSSSEAAGNQASPAPIAPTRFVGIFATGVVRPDSVTPPAPGNSENTADQGSTLSQDGRTMNVAAESPMGAEGQFVELLHLTPASIFTGAMADFADECALVPVSPNGRSSHAWEIIAAAIGLDAALIGYWHTTRRNRNRRPGDNDQLSDPVRAESL